MRRSLVPVLALLLLLPAACSGDDDDDGSDQVVASPSASGSEAEAEATSSTTASTSTSSTTATSEPFDGATTPTSITSGASAVALLTDVKVTDTSVRFTFRDQVPGVDAAYVDEVRMDGSGEVVEAAGNGHLQVRMEPASGVDMSSSSGSYEETYTGPPSFEADEPILEVTRTGDFEANLTWVINLVDERPYRVDVDSLAKTVTVTFAP